jgi:hypothetical protein
MKSFATLLIVLVLSCLATVRAQTPLPKFVVPGFENEMQALERLHQLHHDAAFSNCTLWDGWLPMSTMWNSANKRDQYRQSFLARHIDDEGYVSMQQHRGMAHSEGWPFPAWQQSTGRGFHFSTLGDGWAVQMLGLKALENTDGWEITGADVLTIDNERGLVLKAKADTVTLTTPPFRCGTIAAPFARIEWALNSVQTDTKAFIQWQIEGETSWNEDRKVPIQTSERLQYENIPLYRQPGYAGLLTRYRIRLENSRGSEIHLKSLITAIDTRHPITNALFVRGSCDYFNWTLDLDFLRHNIPRMRTAIEYSLKEFQVREGNHVFVPWVGHDGRSGIIRNADGTKNPRIGIGVGNNYWDLLPFGAHDAIATMYLYDALRSYVELERTIAEHSEWNISTVNKPDIAELTQLNQKIRADFQTRFWNSETQRFNGWIDIENRGYDYGFTFVNLEAIHYGLASPAQTEAIFAWLDGKRQVETDTSRGPDIYQWRFAPRATTKRNIETYVWPWFHPEAIPWGDQVQDGGAVLGFSYFDVMARLQSQGPDAAWDRLQEIINWYREVDAAGGYRSYYSQPGRGTLQGGGTAGGLGLDQEFMESVMVPQVMLYGFLGFQATPNGYTINPKLPKDWPSLKIENIQFQGRTLTITAQQDGTVECQER